MQGSYNCFKLLLGTWNIGQKLKVEDCNALVILSGEEAQPKVDDNEESSIIAWKFSSILHRDIQYILK